MKKLSAKAKYSADVKIQQSIKPLKRGGGNFIAVAARELKSRRFENRPAYRLALKQKTADVERNGRDVACPVVALANQEKSLHDMKREIKTTSTNHPEQTPWSIGGGGWPIRPELVVATRARLTADAKAKGLDLNNDWCVSLSLQR